MAKGLLVSFSGHPVMLSSLFPDNGLASLAGVLIEHGHEVKILDYGTIDVLQRLVPKERTKELMNLRSAVQEKQNRQVISELIEADGRLEEDLEKFTRELAEEISEEVDKQHSHFVGFKMWSGDGFVASVWIANHLRRTYPHLKIFGGGPAVLYSGETIFAHSDSFDALVCGDGEEAILGLAAYAEGKGQLADVPNLLVRDGTTFRTTRRSWVQQLDSLATPCYDLEIYPSLSGNNKLKMFSLDESRGCPMGCAFCIHQSATGNRWRIKTPARVLEEIQTLQEGFGVRAFCLSGSYTPASFYSAFSDMVRQTGTKIQFCGMSHPEGLANTSFERLVEAGCRCLFFGIESFCSDDLVRLGKRLSPKKARKEIQRCMDSGITPVISLIVPAPGQSPEAMDENRRTILQLCRGTSSVLVTTFPGLLPGTRWWKDRAKYGFKLQVSEYEYCKKFASYKIRRVIPIAYWEPLPYTIDGRSFSEFASITARFSKDIFEEGVATEVPDGEVIAANLFEEPVSIFAKRLHSLVFSLDAQGLSDLVCEANNRLTKV